jgi:hypothetical protein
MIHDLHESDRPVRQQDLLRHRDNRLRNFRSELVAEISFLPIDDSSTHSKELAPESSMRDEVLGRTECPFAFVVFDCSSGLLSQDIDVETAVVSEMKRLSPWMTRAQ